MAELIIQDLREVHEQSALEFHLVREADAPLGGTLRSLEPIPVETPAIAQALATRMPAGTILPLGDTLRVSVGSFVRIQAVIRMTRPRLDGDALVVVVFTRGGQRGGSRSVYAVSFGAQCMRPRIRCRSGAIG